MPLIEVKLPQGAILAERKGSLLQALVSAALKAEGHSAPYDPRFVEGTWAYIEELPTGSHAVGYHFSQPGTPIHSLVHVSVPEGLLDEERKQGLVDEVTRAFLRASGAADPRAAQRVLLDSRNSSWQLEGRLPTSVRAHLHSISIPPVRGTRKRSVVQVLI
jgi:phenylpyruvate tautomerase PptA (4-oxalocrotonate tautomerase family)